MKISVCIATYNGEEYITAQLACILQQIGADDEVIISDDSSTDATIKQVQAFKDKRIKIFPNNHFRSPVFNFENAIKKSSGDIIFLADQDDVWSTDKVNVSLQHLKQADMVVSDCYITDANLQITVPSMFAVNNAGSGLLRNTVKNAYLGCCMAFHRRILNKALPFPSDTPMHDIWLGMVADAFYTSRFIPEKLVYYRRHGKNTVQWKGRPVSVFSLRKKLSFRWITLKNLLKLKLGLNIT